MDFILELLSSGATQQDILHTYKHLSSEGINAALWYAAQSLRGEILRDVDVVRSTASG